MGPDAPTIRTLAKKLTFRANLVLIAYGLLFAAGGGAAGLLALEALKHDPHVADLGLAVRTGVAIAAGVGGLLGLVLGSARSAELKLQAQVALAATQVEQNTKTLKKSMSKLARQMGDGEFDSEH